MNFNAYCGKVVGSQSSRAMTRHVIHWPEPDVPLPFHGRCATFGHLPRRRKQSEDAVNDTTIVTESVKRFKWVGTRPIRPDGVPKVTGRALYGADLKLPGMLYGKVLRSPHAHARIKSIDTSAAEALPGVKAVMTAADLPAQKFDYIGPERVAVNFWHVTRNILAREKALYEGHAIAAVAAISSSIAEQAASLIKVDYEVLPHVIDVDEAMAPGAPLLFEDMITRGVEPAPTEPSATSTPGSPPPTS